MKIKIENQTIDAQDQPVMVILSNQDKLNIQNMLPHCTKYACFPNNWGTKKQMEQWMDENDPT